MYYRGLINDTVGTLRCMLPLYRALSSKNKRSVLIFCCRTCTVLYGCMASRLPMHWAERRYEGVSWHLCQLCNVKMAIDTLHLYMIIPWYVLPKPVLYRIVRCISANHIASIYFRRCDAVTACSGLAGGYSNLISAAGRAFAGRVFVRPFFYGGQN